MDPSEKVFFSGYVLGREREAFFGVVAGEVVEAVNLAVEEGLAWGRLDVDAICYGEKAPGPVRAGCGDLG